MTYKSNPVHEALDKVAELSGVPRLKRMMEANKTAHRARRQIVIPAIAITGSISAFIATFYGYALGGALGPIFFAFATAAQYFGPIRVRNAMIPYDEREQLLIWRSRTIGLGTALALAIVGCAMVAIFDALQDIQTGSYWQLPRTSAMAAMWLLMNTATGMATISASLMLPKQIVDDEDQ
jgi:hypothetical protein